MTDTMTGGVVTSSRAASRSPTVRQPSTSPQTTAAAAQLPVTSPQETPAAQLPTANQLAATTVLRPDLSQQSVALASQASTPQPSNTGQQPISRVGRNSFEQIKMMLVQVAQNL
ncbi:hypothetical protein PHYPSEUDO_004525 [Phytophthora pseudosyringae]|uniref:Uncharacterized protein n=1 Tax=Phytophthora pseudosyringae TaxID=221518 RepID=A0A8T1WI17_9STRA|nr:hypothetical protein PHYPSEUDO_004525 [Phytophthora pseudosyringae]